MFIQLIEGHTSDPPALRARIDRWNEELRPGALGFLGSTGGCADDGAFVLAARFEDRDAALRNSERPEQTRWWAETEKCLDGTPTFHETEDVSVMTHGSLDDAHFLQVMEGHVSDRARAEQLERESDPVLAEARPDLLGSFTAFFDDGEFADFAYFTNEGDARANESREMPAEMAEKFAEWERVMKVERYIDIGDPWMTATAA